MLNLTQHDATPNQRECGVVDPTPADAIVIRQWLDFKFLPTREEVRHAANMLAQIACGDSKSTGIMPGHTEAMIGGAPFLMAPLADALAQRGVKAVYAFSQRCSTESVDADGRVSKISVFEHVGFV